MQEKKLRDALEEIYRYIETIIPARRSYPLQQVFDMTEQAFASTTEETEMEKLLRDMRRFREQPGGCDLEKLEGWIAATYGYALEDSPQSESHHTIRRGGRGCLRSCVVG